MNIAKALVERGGKYEITLADQKYYGRLEEFFPDIEQRNRLKIIEADFSIWDSYKLLNSDYDYVYMLAAVVGVNRTLSEPEEVIRINTALVHYTLRWLRQSRVGRLLFASSSENYAATTDTFGSEVPTPETVPLCIADVSHPRFTYAVTKILGESAFLHSANAIGYECTIVRYQNIYGPNMGFRHAIPHVIERFCKGNESPFKVYGADQTRAFCYATDAARGTILAMESERSANEIYHVGNDAEITIDTLTRKVGELMGYEGEYVDAMTYPGSVQRRCPDLAKCREHLGYEPTINLEEGLTRTIKWYRDYFESGRRPKEGGFEEPEKFLSGKPKAL